MAKPSLPSEIVDLIEKSGNAIDECMSTLAALQTAFLSRKEFTAALPENGQSIFESFGESSALQVASRRALVQAYEQLVAATERGRPVLKLVTKSDAPTTDPKTTS